ncbi:MAG TPA: amidase [Pyrinomonadaceae bacterium]|jgi:Asp-tRNA(Asn)/Glu-tRNA(Gln) amidotransferase A subunit family amidase
MKDELTRLSATRLAELVRTRAVSPVEVVEAHLRRIEEANPQLNAIVTLAPDALDCARRAESALMRGEAFGRLHGVPVTVKDTIETGGLRTTYGSRLRAEHVPARDAPAVARLRAAGAIVLGKTNCSEFALEYTADNPVFGRTNHPHDATRTPGGSSGGCAAAVSACLSPLSLGSDLAGSVRIPAHFCGVAALRPTTARVPTAGHLPPTTGAFSLGASLGPLARGVEDVALLYDVLARDVALGEDDTVMAKNEAKNVKGVDESVGVGRSDFVGGRTRLRGCRVAWYTDDGVVRVTEETRRAVVAAADALAASGLEVVEERPPGVEHGARLWHELFSPATQNFLREMYDGRVDEGGAMVQAMLRRSHMASRHASNDASLHASNDADALGRYFRAWSERDGLRRTLLEWMKRTPLVVAPVGAVAAFAHGTRKVSIGASEVSVFRAFGYAQTFNVFDLPAASVPAGRTQDNLPIGVQIVGRPFAEETVLVAARIVEEALGDHFQRG